MFLNMNSIVCILFSLIIQVHAQIRLEPNVTFDKSTFGSSLSSSGLFLAIGAPTESTVIGRTGTVYIFETLTPNNTFQIISGHQGDEKFGSALSLIGDNLLVFSLITDQVAYNASVYHYKFNGTRFIEQIPILETSLYYPSNMYVSPPFLFLWDPISLFVYHQTTSYQLIQTLPGAASLTLCRSFLYVGRPRTSFSSLTDAGEVTRYTWNGSHYDLPLVIRAQTPVDKDFFGRHVVCLDFLLLVRATTYNVFYLGRMDVYQVDASGNLLYRQFLRNETIPKSTNAMIAFGVDCGWSFPYVYISYPYEDRVLRYKYENGSNLFSMNGSYEFPFFSRGSTFAQNGDQIFMGAPLQAGISGLDVKSSGVVHEWDTRGDMTPIGVFIPQKGIHASSYGSRLFVGGLRMAIAAENAESFVTSKVGQVSMYAVRAPSPTYLYGLNIEVDDLYMDDTSLVVYADRIIRPYSLNGSSYQAGSVAILPESSVRFYGSTQWIMAFKRTMIKAYRLLRPATLQALPDVPLSVYPDGGTRRLYAGICANHFLFFNTTHVFGANYTTGWVSLYVQPMPFVLGIHTVCVDATLFIYGSPSKIAYSYYWNGTWNLSKVYPQTVHIAGSASTLVTSNETHAMVYRWKGAQFVYGDERVYNASTLSVNTISAVATYLDKVVVSDNQHSFQRYQNVGAVYILNETSFTPFVPSTSPTPSTSTSISPTPSTSTFSSPLPSTSASASNSPTPALPSVSPASTPSRTRIRFFRDAPDHRMIPLNHCGEEILSEAITIRFQSLEEKRGDTIVQSIVMADQSFARTTSGTAFVFEQTQLGLAVNVTQIQQETTGRLLNRPFHIQDNTNKLTLSMSNWTFGPSSDRLCVLFSMERETDFPPFVSTQVDGGLAEERVYANQDVQLTVKILQQAIIDGVLRPVNITWNQTRLRATVKLCFPVFSTLDYDPNFGLTLLNDDPNASCSSSRPIWMWILLALVLAGVLLVFGVMSYQRWKTQERYRMERRAREELLSNYARGETLPTSDYVQMEERATTLHIQGWGNVTLSKTLAHTDNATVSLGLLASGQQVVVKKTTHDIDKEISILQGLKHPNIIGLLYATHRMLVMEYADGGALSSILPIQPSYFRKILIQVVSALSYMHDKGVAHRDIKAENIFLTATGTVKVGDFGASKHLVAANNETAIGTPYFMAPEVIHGTVTDWKAADVWSLGASMYQWIHGKPPLLEHGPVSAMFYIGSESETVCDRMDWHGIPHDIEQLIRRCMTANPMRRPKVRDICL